jgi:hypothetical protein
VEPDPLSGFVTVHAEPLSYQYPVAVVVNTCGAEAPYLFAVNVGAVGEPPPLTPYESVNTY